jgi:hypothetical protein
MIASASPHRRLLLPGLVLLVFLVACSRRPPSAEPDQQQPATTAVPRPDDGVAAAGAAVGPRITFTATSHDFGRVPEIAEHTATFRFSNTGDQPLVISRVKTTCGCAAATPDKRRYLPDEEGRIDVVFEPSAPGPQRKYVNVFNNADPDGPTKLMIIADVEPFLVIEPRLLDLGVLPPGREHHVQVRVSADDPEMEVESVRTTHPHLSARVEEQADPDGARLIDVTVSAAAPWGPVFSWLDITARARPDSDAEPIRHSRRLRVQGRLFGELHAEPDTFRMGVAPGVAFNRTVRLHRPSGEPFEVLEVTIDASRLAEARVDVEPGGDGSYRLVLHATAAGTPGSINGAVHIRTDVPGEESLSIQISGSVRSG